MAIFSLMESDGLFGFLHQRPWGYKTSFVLNSADHEIYHAHKC